VWKLSSIQYHSLFIACNLSEILRSSLESLVIKFLLHISIIFLLFSFEAERKFLDFPKYHHVIFAPPTIFHIILLSISLFFSLPLPIASSSPTLYPPRLFISHRFFTYPLNHLSQIFYLNPPIFVSFKIQHFLILLKLNVFNIKSIC
jgi:hypothetical protein